LDEFSVAAKGAVEESVSINSDNTFRIDGLPPGDYEIVPDIQIVVTGNPELVLARLTNLGFNLTSRQSPAGQLLGSIPKIQLVRAAQVAGVRFIIPAGVWGFARGFYWAEGLWE
jgi:hypothetical protein